jgi:hypothetical protein
MSTPKTTAVDWLQEKIQSNLSEPMSPKFAELFEQAREMEREQIIEFADGYSEQVLNGIPYFQAREYYDDIYGKSE